MPNVRVNLKVSLLLSPSEGDERLDMRAAENAAQEAVQSALSHAEREGFDHSRANEICIGIGHIEVESAQEDDSRAERIVSKLGLKGGELDEAVQSAKGGEASDLNNDTPEAQVAYLLEDFEGDDKAAEQYIKDQIED